MTKISKIIILATILVLAAFWGKVTFVQATTGFVCPADSASCPSGAVCFQNPLCAESLDQLLGAIADFIFKLGLVIAPIMLIIAGFFFVTSMGDPNRVRTAKNIIMYTLIGLAIVLLASGLVKVLQSVLGA